VLSELFELIREQHEPTNGVRNQENSAQSGKNALDAARIELGKAEIIAQQMLENDAGD